MRLISIAAAAVTLAACGGPETSQANNAQANISNEARPSATGEASATIDLAMFAPSASKDVARKVMHDRHEGMEGIGKSNKLIKQELNASSPNLELVRYSASRMVAASNDANGWFAKGTGAELGKTGAKPEIWQNEQDVAAKLAAFQKAAQAFEQAARGTDVNLMKARFSSMSGTCKACHDKYRSQMHH